MSKMSKSDKMNLGLVPKLRFPEFAKTGEWEEKKLGELGELISGLTYSPDDIRDKGLLVLRSSNIKNNSILLDDNVYVREDINGANLSAINDILICVRNGSKNLIGKNAIIPKDMPLCTHGAFMTIFRTKFSKFVLQLFQSQAYQMQVKADLGATINSINGTHFKKYIFNIPKLPEQEKISDCLSSLDDIISLEDKKHTSLKEHKKGLMQKLFPAEGKTVPELRFKEFQNSPNWEEKTLSILADKVTNRNKDNSISRVLTNSAVDGVVDQSDYFDREIANKNNLDNYFIINKNDYVYNPRISVTAPVGPISRNKIGTGVMSPLYTVFRFKNKNNNDFYEQYFKTSHWYNYLKSVSNTGARHDRISISNDTFMNMPLPCLTDKEQQKIAECLSSLDDLISAQAEKIITLKIHKKYLMQNLFPAISEVN